MKASPNGIVRTTAPTDDRMVAYAVELVIWTAIWWSISWTFDMPTWTELVSTWPLFIVYKTTMLWKTGSTLGHLTTGVRIVNNATGEGLTFRQATLRTLPEISYELLVPLVINAAMAATRRDRRHTFDFLAATVAVQRTKETPQ